MLKRVLRRLRFDEAGATAIEYALLGAFIAAVITASVSAIGSRLLEKYGLVASLFP
ncbi:MAG: Flp family type IVb pilin [Rhodospirillales bacterium]